MQPIHIPRCFAIGAMSLCACATAGRDVGQGVTVRSNSSDAVASVVQAQSGTTVTSGNTPLVLRMQGTGLYTGGKYYVTVEKPGFPKRQFTVNLATVRGWGGLLAWIIVDPANGSVWQLDNHRSGLVWAPAPGEESFTNITGYVIATLDDVRGSAKAMAAMKPVSAPGSEARAEPPPDR